MSDLTPGNRLDRPVDDKFDHILGPPDAAITLVEYGSYACPYCRAANERIAEVRDQFLSAVAGVTLLAIAGRNDL
jgi:Na+:H+ antiporter, NhaA family